MEKDILGNLPNELSYLENPARKYGKYQFDDDTDKFISSASDVEIKMLKDLATKVRNNGHYPLVIEWFQAHESEGENNAYSLYALFGVLDALDFKFD